MYFIVYLENLRKNVILPKTWIKDIDDHMEKFLNYGLNTVQRFMCFYTKNELTFDPINGSPYENYPANFDLPLNNTIDDEGFYTCQLKKFKSKYIKDT